MAFSGTLQITDQDVRTVQPSVQPSGLTQTRVDTQLGVVGTTTDGRQYVFGQNNITTAAVAGNLQTGSAQVANHATRTLTTAAAAGATSVLVPLGATAATADQYQGGFLSVVSGTVPAVALRIRGNSVAASSGTTTVTLDEPTVLALTTSSVVSLMAAPTYLFAVTSTTVTANNYVGVPNVAVPTSNWAWLQVGGLCQVTTDATTFAKNTGVIGSSATAGAVAVEAASSVTQRLGYTIEAAASSSTGLVNLQII